MIEKPVFENAEQVFKVFGEPQISSWWQTLRAKLFGARLEMDGDGFKIVAYSYGGILHVTEMIRVPKP